MKRTITPVTLMVVLTVTIGLLAQEQPEKLQQPSYYVDDLGTLGGTFSFAGGLNNKGSVGGATTVPGDTVIHSFLWREGQMTDLGTLGGPNSDTSWRLNDRDEVGGVAETSDADPLGEDFSGFGTNLISLPFVWQKGVMTPLPTLGGNNGRANGVNNRGQVVGRAETSTPDPTCEPPQVLQSLPVIWRKGKIEEVLPTLAGDSRGGAVAINSRGQAVGFSGDCTTFLHAVLWQGGTATDLGNLGGQFTHVATSINNRGQVTGVSDLTGDEVTHAFLWENGVMTDIGTLPGDSFSFGDGINSHGHVVGASCDADFNCRAFLWRHGVMVDLNTLISPSSPLFLIEASGGMNSHGQIAGYAMQINTGEIHAFRLTPRKGASGAELPVFGAQGETRQSQKFFLPGNVRSMLREHLGSQRRGIGF